MRKEDIEQVVEIENETFPSLPSTNYQRELMIGIAFYTVACDQNQVITRNSVVNTYLIIGMTGFCMMAGEAHIVNMVVREAYRRRGVGELLLKQLIRMALEKGAITITLEVRKSNIEAQKFYKSFGFKKKGIRYNYYNDNREDAVIMTVFD
jgi:ribosomal-protein-alanine N-acetyltransferase